MSNCQLSTNNYQLPEGYNQTEVGVIPEDWDVKPLCDIAEIRSGIAKNSKAFVNDPILVHYLRVANVQDGFLDLTEMKKIEVSRNDIKHYSVLPGDILMNEGGDLDKLGRGSMWRGEFNPCVHQNHVFVVRSRSSISSEYLNTWTGGASARRYFLVAGKQTTNLATINKTALGQLPVALPPKKEQRSIAQTLSDVDALIAALDKLIAKKRYLKTATMQQLLTGKKRLPRRMENGEWRMENDGNPVMFGPSVDNCQLSIDKYQLPKGYKQTEVGVIPEDWEVVPLSALFDFQNGVNANKEAYGHGTPFINVLEVITTTHLSASDIPGRVSLSKAISESYAVHKGDILFNRTSETQEEVGLASVYLGDEKVVFGGFVIRGRNLGKSVDPIYSGYVFRSPNIRSQIIARGQGAVRANIGQQDLYKILTILPSIEEQRAIATVLSEMDAEIAALEARRTKTQAIKQGMMQQLLTGKVRLLDGGIDN